MRGFAQRGLLILLSLFLFDLGARCPRSLSSISSIIWLERHGYPRRLIPKARDILCKRVAMLLQRFTDLLDTRNQDRMVTHQARIDAFHEGVPPTDQSLELLCERATW